MMMEPSTILGALAGCYANHVSALSCLKQCFPPLEGQ